MSHRRVEMDRLQELVRLHRMGSGSRQVARLLRMGPNTERQYREALGAAGLLEGPVDTLPDLGVLKMAVEEHASLKGPAEQRSSLECWREKVAGFIKKGLGPQAIYDRLRLENKDFSGSLSAVKRLYRRIRREGGVNPEAVAIPVETDPGQVAQVDFGYAGKLYDPQTATLRKAWVFVMVLGFSRHMVARVVFDQKIDTWLRLHAEAFSELGGVIDTVVPDNLKSAVIRAAFGIDDQSGLNRSYREFARHYGFKIDPTPVGDPRKKGKVESGVKYVKRNGLSGREGTDVTEVRAALQRWVYEIAGLRHHGTTGKRPLEVFEQFERAALLPLPAGPFDPVVWKEATVHPDTHVVFDKRLYSVPFKLIGKKVWVRGTSSTVTIYFDDVRIATHDRRGPSHRSTIEEHLPEHRADLRHRSHAYWLSRADRIGPETGTFISEVFDSDRVLSMLRVVQAMVTHLETFPVERAEGACRRARFYGNYSYRGLKGILRRALDLEPLPALVSPSASSIDQPRFARRVSDLFDLPLEVTDEPH